MSEHSAISRNDATDNLLISLRNNDGWEYPVRSSAIPLT